MKRFIAALIMVVATGLASGPSPASPSAVEVKTNAGGSQVDSSASPFPQIQCNPQRRRCCEYDDDTGKCRIWQVCVAGGWYCP